MKISVIGAGSAQFSLGLIRDICLTPELKGALIQLMDIDEDRLDITHKLALKYADELGVDIRFHKTTNRTEALHNADFIVNTALAGGHEHMERERSLLEQHGYYRGIGVNASYLQLALMHEIACEVAQHCPDAWLIQSANPLVEGCTLMYREAGIKVVGLCHGFFEYHKMAQVLGMTIQDVEIEALGFNHCIWMTKFHHKREDAYPALNDWIENHSEHYWQTWEAHHADLQMSRASIDLYKFYSLMPIGDTCRAIWPETWWYHTDINTKKRWWGDLGGFDSEIGWEHHLKWLEERTNSLSYAATSNNLPITKLFPPEKSLEQIVPVILALSGYEPDRPVYQVNVPNDGMFEYLPDDIFVEGPAIITKDNIQLAPETKLPQIIKLGAIMPRYLLAERIISAHMQKDLRFFAQTYLSDNRTNSKCQVDAALSNLVNMCGNEQMKQHYRGSL